MADLRNMIIGIGFRTRDSVSGIEEVQDAIHGVTEEAYEAESEMAKFGSEAAAGAGMAADGFRRAADSAGGFRDATKKTENFVKRTVAGAGKIGKAFRHPIQTIKNKMVSALERAGIETDGLGTHSKNTERDLDDMGKAGEKAGNGIREALGSVVGKLAALKAGFEIIKAGVETVKNLSTALVEVGKETQAVNAKFGAVFNDKAVGIWADNFATAVNRSKTEVKGFLVSNKALYQELGITGEAADRLSEITTSLAYDLGAALKIDDEESLSAVQDYINGNAAALSQYGIQIDEAILKQTALNMGYGSNIENLKDAELAQVRMNALLENSNSIQRQAAEGQVGYANNIKSLKAVVTNFGGQAAEKLSPVFDKLTGSILKSWPKIEGTLLKFIGYLGEKGIGAALPELVNMAATALPPFMDMLMQTADAAQPIGTALISLATTALPPLMKALTPVVGVIGELAGTVLPPLGKIIAQISETIIPPFSQVLGTLNKTVITPLMPVITQIADAILPALAAGMQALSPLLELVSPVLEKIGTILGEVVGFLGKAAEYVAGGIGDLFGKVSGFFGGGDKKAGTDIPHNANGTENFAGGLTYINERGGEIAVLPSGSKVIPADKSRLLAESMSGGTSANVKVELTVNVEGGADEKLIEKMEEAARQIAEKVSEAVYRKMKEKELEREAIQEGLT